MGRGVGVARVMGCGGVLGWVRVPRVGVLRVRVRGVLRGGFCWRLRETGPGGRGCCVSAKILEELRYFIAFMSCLLLESGGAGGENDGAEGVFGADFAAPGAAWCRFWVTSARGVRGEERLGRSEGGVGWDGVGEMVAERGAVEAGRVAGWVCGEGGVVSRAVRMGSSAEEGGVGVLGVAGVGAAVFASSLSCAGGMVSWLPGEGGGWRVASRTSPLGSWRVVGPPGWVVRTVRVRPEAG